MAEQYERFKRFEYRMNSNLVLQRDGPGPNQNEATGEPESLVGRLYHKMGDKVSRDAAKPRLETKRRPKSVTEEPAKHRRIGLDINKEETVLTIDVAESTHYVPSSQHTRAKYEEILNMLQQSLGDQPQDVLKGACEEVILQLRMPNLKAEDRREGCEEVLGPISDDVYYRLYHTAKELTDYTVPGEQGSRMEMADDPSGVAVIFDEDEDAEFDVDSVAEEECDENIDIESQAQPIRQENARENLNLETDKYHLPISRIDPHWLQRELNLIFGDPNVAVATEKEILSALKLPDVQECENRLVLILKYENFEFAKLVLCNRWKIMYCTRLGQAQTADEKVAIFEEMRQTPEGMEVLHELEVINLRRSKEQELTLNVTREAANLAKSQAKRSNREGNDNEDEGYIEETAVSTDVSSIVTQPKVLDLASLAFKDGSQHMTNTKVILPEDSERVEHKSYDEVIIYPLERPRDLYRKPIKSFPEWTHNAFPGTESLNPVQSLVSEVAFEHFEENILVCAPTGAGKTNVAVLAMLSVIARHRNEDGTLNLNEFKMVYVSPMKSLVMEQAQTFSQRFASYNLTVREVTGDISLTRSQLMETQLVVTTPEKWDVVTRRSGIESSVELLIFDEIHLLHDKRGPVLEALVARTLHNDRKNRWKTRLIGLSATLPNYLDIAEFLKVDPERGLFYFGNHYRPVGLEQRYIGIKEKKAIKRYNCMNEIVYERVMEEAGKNQLLLFVHSRKETARTAKLIRDTALMNDTLNAFLHKDSASREILVTEAEAIKTPELKELLPYGFGIHHAGLPRADRKLVEDLFADGHVQLLVSTATLSWGVNLPAHTVIIKGTQVYSPEEGCWTELCPLSVQQMMGRAGRPQYDKEGKGIIVTSHDRLQFYLSLNNQQLPIESQLINNIPELLNAEIVLGNITTRRDAVSWLKDTYFAVRMRKEPRIYGVIPQDSDGEDPTTIGEDIFLDRLESLAHSGLVELETHALIRYERRSGSIQPTGMGKIASLYYLKPQSVKAYADNLRPGLSDSDLLRIFSSSVEFRYIPVREEEKVELAALMEKVPIPVRGHGQESACKIAVLLQSYISRFSLEGYALVSEMTFITQNAGRIMRALYEICLKRSWSQLAQRLFEMCKMIDRRMWAVMIPLRQFKSLPEELILKLERNDFGWDRYYDLSSVELGELCRQPKLGKVLHRMVHFVPKLELQVFVQPLTRQRLKVEVTISPDFQWDTKFHGSNERFWLFVEDGSGEEILYSQTFVLLPFSSGSIEEHSVFFTVGISEPLCSHYFLRVISERWLGSSAKVSISFNRLILPDKLQPHCELLDLQPLPISALANVNGAHLNLSKGSVKSKFGGGYFNAVQTQTFSCFFSNSDSVLLCAPFKAGKFMCAEVAIVRCLSTCENATVIVVCPFESLVEIRLERLRMRFGEICKLDRLTGDVKNSLKTISESSIVVCTPKQWDFVSRRWKSRQCLQRIDLFIVENLELLDDVTVGPEMEIAISRMRFIAAQLSYPTRIIGLSIPISNALDVGGWIGAPANNIFSFPPSVREVPLVVSIQSFDQWEIETRRFAMFNNVCTAIMGHFQKSDEDGIGISTVLVFAPDRRFCRLLSMDVLLSLDSDYVSGYDCQTDGHDKTIEGLILREKALGKLLQGGVGYCHEGFNLQEIRAIETLFEKGKIRVMISTPSLVWSLRVSASLVIVADVSVSSTNRSLSQGVYPQSDLLRMINFTSNNSNSDIKSAAGLIMLEAPKREHCKKLLYEVLPIESALESRLEELLNAEIVQGAIENAQDAIDWLTWTLYYLRLSKNPNFYSLQGSSSQHLSEHLSELVESTFKSLERSQCVSLNDSGDSASPLNLGYIAAFYYLRCGTIEMFSKSISPEINREGLLDVISNSEEFSDLVCRVGERIGNVSLHENQVPLKVKELIKAHIHRAPLSNDLQSDQALLLERLPPLLCALIDVISSNGWLSPALLCMDMSQRIVQALTAGESPLKQLPHITTEFIARAKELGVEDIFDLMGMDDDARDDLLKIFTAKQTSDIASFCNSVQVLDVKYSLNSDNVPPRESLQMQIHIEKEGDETDVVSPYFPLKRQEQWWIVVGETEANCLYGIKRTTLPKGSNEIKIDFEAPAKPGEHQLVLYVVSDSYVGTDYQHTLTLTVVP